jgi:hypothetical protein
MAFGFTCDINSSVGCFSSLGFMPFKGSSDCFQDCVHRDVWGTLKIKLLDTTFWASYSNNPDRYGERLRNKLNLFEYDFVVMPLFGE